MSLLIENPWARNEGRIDGGLNPPGLPGGANVCGNDQTVLVLAWPLSR